MVVLKVAEFLIEGLYVSSSRKLMHTSTLLFIQSTKTVTFCYQLFVTATATVEQIEYEGGWGCAVFVLL